MGSTLDQLTTRQHDIYQFIRDKIQNRGYGPTVREIGEEFRISSPNGVMCHLKAIEKKGLISRAAGKSRAIQISQAALDEERGLPLVGVVAAGAMQEAVEDHERIDFADFFKKKNLFVLKVKGESMIDAHIADGDYVVIREQRTAHPGQMVVARTEDGEATLKYWHPEGGRIRLQPANSAMDPIYVKSASIVGVVVGVVRSCA